jgi:hypothetical protein
MPLFKRKQNTFFTRPVIHLEVIYTPELAELFEWIKYHASIAYHDNVMKEDIYDLDETEERIIDGDVQIDDNLLEYLVALHKLSRKKGTAYIQLVSD